MSIEEIIALSTIGLPRDLTLKEAEKLFIYIAKKLPGDVRYNASYFKSLIHSREPENEGLLIDDGTAQIVGTISRSKEPYAFDSFSTTHSEKDTSKLSAISFQRVPGWELPEYHRVRPLWDDVRDIVTQYFE